MTAALRRPVVVEPRHRHVAHLRPIPHTPVDWADDPDWARRTIAVHLTVTDIELDLFRSLLDAMTAGPRPVADLAHKLTNQLNPGDH
jgi:hypothetical protein